MRQFHLFIHVPLALLVVGFLTTCEVTSPAQNKYRSLPHLYSISEGQFHRSIDGLLGEPLADGNKVETLVNGIKIFPSMLEAIKNADQSINFETYIYWSGTIGAEFAHALSERARNGVQVRIILDWVGAGKIDHAYLNMMKEAGAHIIQYRPLRWYNISRLNYRTHRKLLIIDGRIGFTGGVGIADEWSGNAEDKDHWRDTHYRIEGPAVSQIQGTFAEHWLRTEGEVLHDHRQFPIIERVGQSRAQMLKSSPSEGIWVTQLLYRLAIAAATKEILLQTPYFIPDELTEKALIDAANRGVEIRINVPGPNIDNKIVREVSRDGWEPFLRAGIKFYEYQKTMFHCKLLVVDRLWSSVGSTNFDNRSFRLNDEANLNVVDLEFAAEQVKIFENDIAQSKQITLKEWKRQPWYRRLMAKVYSLVESQL